MSVETAKRNVFIRDWDKLRFQVKTTERDVLSAVNTKHQGLRTFHEAEETLVVTRREIEVERKKINENLLKIRGKMVAFQQQLSKVKSTPDFVEKLKRIMEDVEITITGFKEGQRKQFERLVEEEEELKQEIGILEKRIEKTKNQTCLPTSGYAGKVTVRANSSSTLPPEVDAYEKFVAANGAQGGWDDYDHGLFLRIRTKYKGKKGFVNAAVSGIPGRGLREVTKHEEWYKTFEELTEKKKEAISNWKMEKEKENVKKETESMLRVKEKEEMKKKKEKERMEEQERLKKKEIVESWKQKKEEQRKLEAEEIRQNELRKKRIKENEQRELNEMREAAKEQLRLKREEDEREHWRMELEEEERRSAKKEEAQHQIARFQNRDQLNLKWKMREKKMKEEEQKKREERIGKARANIKVESDRNRLYQPTDAWLQRNRQRDSKEKMQPGVVLPHKAVPSWRQGV
ncbi:coiled-coil domain-containing protein 112-like [Ciona intestinalis]